MTPDTPARLLQDRAVLWSIGELPAPDLVQAACDALVAGLDSPTLRRLAALTRAEAGYDVRELLPGALDELGLVCPVPGSTAGQEAAARVFCRRLLRGELSPRALAFWAHRSHGHDLPLTARLAELDDAYDMTEYGGPTAAELDAEVTAEARRLAAGP
ncbi:hypothetical protein [Streptomyces albidoflavus]|uniref:hypothetical protein n=1 Tax=Streptomyces albidoflavus TaxID=1886 RepID=UPI0033AEFF58